MRKLLLILVGVLMFVSIASADVYVSGYTKSNGTYVAPHYRTNPNSTTADNYSSGAYNPHTVDYGYQNSGSQYGSGRNTGQLGGYSDSSLSGY